MIVTSVRVQILWCVLKESGKDVVEFRRKVESGREITGAIRSLVIARGVQRECARVLDEGLLVPVLLYVSETMMWREQNRSRIKAVHMDNL